MNFYPRYPGDYAKKTARLTLAEHGAYALLLDELYSSEEPLPADTDELCRICRAISKAEREAVIRVVEKFFPQGPDGFRRNERAEEEITKARPKIDAAKANGKKGGRPKKEPTEEPNREPTTKPNGFPENRENGNPAETQWQSSPHPEPDSSLRSEKTHTEFSADVGRVGSDAGEVCRAMKAQGIADVNPGHLDLLTLLNAGATRAEFEGAAIEARGRGKGFTYAIGIVKRRREEAAKAAPLHHGAMPQRQPTQAELNATAAGYMTGATPMPTPTRPQAAQPETIDVESRLIAP